MTFYDSNNRIENDMEKWELMKNEEVVTKLH